MYSPKIREDLVKKLFLLKMSYASLGVNKPMTEMVREALKEYIQRKVKEIIEAGGTLIMPQQLFDKSK